MPCIGVFLLLCVFFCFCFWGCLFSRLGVPVTDSLPGSFIVMKGIMTAKRSVWNKVVFCLIIDEVLGYTWSITVLFVYIITDTDFYLLLFLRLHAIQQSKWIYESRQQLSPTNKHIVVTRYEAIQPLEHVPLVEPVYQPCIYTHTELRSVLKSRWPSWAPVSNKLRFLWT